MADLYGAAPSPAAAEPEEISTFLHHLLHHNNNNNNNGTSSSSSSLVPPYSKFMHHHHPHQHAPPEAACSDLLDRRRFGRSESYCRFNFSDPGGYFAKEAAENAVSSSGGSKRRSGSVENCLGDFGCDSEKGAEVSGEVPPSEPVLPRSSSKRSRAAEVHNLSEKRRRSRINEKMKALQTLIPNSNKTDKASMLDEAIEYLKQLQLQVQMLTMRNGLSLHPMCLPGVLQPMQLPLTGMSFDDGSGLLTTNAAGGTFSANEDGSAQTALNLPNQGSVSNQAVVIPSGTNINSSETSFGFEPLIQANYGPFNLSTSSKEICREGTPQPQVDPNQAVKNPASGVS